MKLSEETREIITSIRNINPGCVFKAGSIIKAKKHKATAPIIQAVIAEELPRDFAIFDLKKFVSMFQLLEDPDLDFQDQGVVFSDEKGRSAQINYAAITVIDHLDYSKKIALPSVDQEFIFTDADFKTMRQATSSFTAPEIAFIGNGKTISAVTNDSKNAGTDKFSIKLGETDKKFKIILNAEDLQFLVKTYTVKICFRGLLEFKTQDEKLTYWITMSDKSKVG